MKELILYIIHLHNTMTGTGMYMGLYFATLLFAAFYIKEKSYRYRLVYPALFIMPMVYLVMPAIHKLLFFVELNKETQKGRYFWMFMVTPVVAVGCTYMVGNLKERKQKMLLCVALVPVLAACGVFQISDYRFPKAENIYKLPQVFIDISDAVVNEQKAEGDGRARMIVPYETAYTFRQYTLDIELLYGEDATFGRIKKVRDERKDVCDTMQTTCPDLDLISEVAGQHDMEYIIFDKSYVDFGLESLNSEGYTEDENFVGDRTPDPDARKRMREKVSIDSAGDRWDLSSYGMEYKGSFGRYLLYGM